jgi:hygromycin-B 4-O-kinase
MKPDVSLDDIATFLAVQYTHVEYIQQLVEGEESLAYSAIADGNDIVVRINRTRDGFDKDAYVANNWPVVRAPQVLKIEPISDAWLCISNRVPGSTLQSLGAKASAYCQDVVGLLDAMAACDTSHIAGLGPFKASGRGLFQSWQEFMMSVVGPNDLVWFVRDYQYGDHRALVHGDFGSNNVLAENGSIAGIIDWSEAMIGDPLYDTANLFFWRTWLVCMDVQCRYMELHTVDRLKDQEKLRRYQVRIGLQVAADARAVGDTKMEMWALDRTSFIFATAPS